MKRGRAGLLRCYKCRRTEPLNDTASYFLDGWPHCCGYTMEWLTNRQLGEQSDGPGAPDA